MKLTKRILALALAAPLFLVTACGGEDTPEQTPSPENSSSASETPKSGQSPAKNESSPATAKEYKPATLEHPAQNVPVPKYPEAGKKDNKKGREAAAKFFLESFDYVKQSGDDTPLRQVAYSECDECFEYANKVEEWYSDGNWIFGGLLQSVKVAEEGDIDQYGRYRVNFIIEEKTGRTVRKDESDSDKEMDPPSRSKGTLWVQYVPADDRIIVVQFEAYDKQFLS